MKLVGTFILTDSGKNVGERQSLRSRGAGSDPSVGASLVSSAKANLVHSTSNPTLAARRSSKPTRTSSATKSDARPRATKSAVKQPVLVAVASDPAGNDASFEEF